jgi:hypothetical protein
MCTIVFCLRVSFLFLYRLPHVEMVSLSSQSPCPNRRAVSSNISYRLINYTPQATMVRLLTIDVINAYITLTALSLSGGFQDPRLLLPGWIIIATVCQQAAYAVPARANQTDKINSDPHCMLPHYTPKNQHPQRNIHLSKRLLDSKLHKHGDTPHPHAALPA